MGKRPNAHTGTEKGFKYIIDTSNESSGLNEQIDVNLAGIALGLTHIYA